MPAMTEPKKRSRSGGRPKGPRAPRKMLVAFKGYEEFGVWLESFASALRLPKSVLIEHALIEYAREHGFDVPAPER